MQLRSIEKLCIKTAAVFVGRHTDIGYMLGHGHSTKSQVNRAQADIAYSTV